MLEALPPGPPRLVGPYRLLARLGAGGMGEVHLACRADEPTADPHRMVAVKTVRGDLEVDGDFRTRFRREITAARAVSSPYAARLVDADADAPAPWLATEYVPGPSLAEAVVRSGALPAGAVRALGAALARALRAVHEAKVLHRDLKPANVLLGPGGPKLIDFGIAQAFEATALTSTGLVVGSPGFMSPEHLTGSRAVVPASDVFCLGAVLAFAASGRGPFHDDEMAAVIFRISRAEADLSGVPEELRPVVERCLRPDPADRPTAAELVGLLGAEAPEVFPWPGGVLSLLAEHGEAARGIGEAAASGAGVADLPTLAPVVPYSPTALGQRPAAAAVPEPRRRPWGRWVAAAVAVAVVATVGAVLVDRQGGRGNTAGGTAGGAGATAGPAGGSSPSAGSPAPSTPRSLSQVVQPYGGEGRSGDFGTVGTDRAYRPAGWSPWTTKVDTDVTGCALSPEVLLCPGTAGSAVALRAADGEKLWSVPGRELTDAEGIRSPAGYPAVVGDTAYVTGPDGVVAYGLEDGRQRGRIAAPGGRWALKSTDLVDGVLYSGYLDPGDETKGLVTAVKLADGGRELWRARLDGVPEQLVAGGGRVIVPLGVRPVALDAATGRETARGAADLVCGEVVVHGESVLCGAGPDDGVTVLDAGTLRPRRTLGADLTITAGPAVNADGVVALVDGGSRVVTYDLDSGRERWRAQKWVTQAGAPLGRVWFAGDQVLAGGRQEVLAVPVSGPPARPQDIPVLSPPVPDGVSLTGDAEAVAAGGAVFLSLSDGLVVSGYLPRAGGVTPSPTGTS
ncbi:protein kinase [Streptomyces sp. NPDC058745]|uniref:protein kinase domain-containing protein n=1 Tax=Streptomyces sp. NPDC058745 TaxID=3346621 RepID=UPI0036B05901